MNRLCKFILLSSIFIGTSSLFNSAAWAAIPCTTEALSANFNAFMAKQPLCITPCESARTDKRIYEYGISLLHDNCPANEAQVLQALRDLQKLLAESDETIEQTCKE